MDGIKTEMVMSSPSPIETSVGREGFSKALSMASLAAATRRKGVGDLSPRRD